MCILNLISSACMCTLYFISSEYVLCTWFQVQLYSLLNIKCMCALCCRYFTLSRKVRVPTRSRDQDCQDSDLAWVGSATLWSATAHATSTTSTCSKPCSTDIYSAAWLLWQQCHPGNIVCTGMLPPTVSGRCSHITWCLCVHLCLLYGYALHYVNL